MLDTPSTAVVLVISLSAASVSTKDMAISWGPIPTDPLLRSRSSLKLRPRVETTEIIREVDPGFEATIRMNAAPS